MKYKYKDHFRSIHELFFYRIDLKRLVIMTLLSFFFFYVEGKIANKCIFSFLATIFFLCIIVHRLIVSWREYYSVLYFEKGKILICTATKKVELAAHDFKNAIYVVQTEELILVSSRSLFGDLNLYKIDQSEAERWSRLVCPSLKLTVRESRQGRVL